MLFNSLEFLIFFPLISFLYFGIPHRFRWLLLLIASYIFYMFWRVDYAIILVISTLIDYLCSRMMDRYSEEDRTKRKPWLWLSLLSNLGILFTFKYYNFFNSAAKDLAEVLGMVYAAPAFELLLPMGISFYTFQTMSYTIDVYYGRIKAEKHFGIFALFVTFFPQLVAGPIERAGNLLGQLKQKHEFSYERVTDGLKLMAWGFFKKIVIADRLAMMVNNVYNNPTDFEGAHLIIATVFFAFQIYCDFSGYSDIAIGSAQVMGFKLMENFRRPYFSKSIKEFWSRWHISLSTWFRDYLYIPLGGNRVLEWRWYYNVFIVFLVSGLWHGANWTFIIWGALHGTYQITGSLTATKRDELVGILKLDRYKRLYSFVQIGTTFSLVCFAWIFFRANSISDAWYISTHLFHNLWESSESFIKQLVFERRVLGKYSQEFVLAIAFIVVMEGVHFLQRHRKVRPYVSGFHPFYRWTIYSFYLLVFIYFGVFNSNSFIYFQF